MIKPFRSRLDVVILGLPPALCYGLWVWHNDKKVLQPLRREQEKKRLLLEQQQQQQKQQQE
jgi:hypothetical protein